MHPDDQPADNLIPGSLRRSESYHADYGTKSYGEIKRLAQAKPPDKKARQMKKLIEEAAIMNTLPAFKKGLARIRALSTRGDYEAAFSEAERLLRIWPDNPHLLLLQAELIQLCDASARPLNQARAALERSVTLDPEAPQPHLELGHFKFAVADAAKEALQDFDRAISLCQRLLREALTGKAKALAELGKREEALGCLAAAYWQEMYSANGNGHAKEILAGLEELRTVQ